MSGPRFPQDLIQAGDAKCSLDALLLAAFVEGRHERAVDLGAGCGVVGLGLLLRGVAGSVIGLDKDEAQVEAARKNARLFDLSHRYAAYPVDFAADFEGYPETRIEPESPPSDLAVCNPPWRLEGAQRLPRSLRRQEALYGTQTTLALFARAGACRLRRGGRYAAVVGAQRLADMFRALDGANLRLTRLRLVHSRPGRAAVFALLEARLRIKASLRVEPPLILHENGAYSEQVLAFCRWLSN